VLFSAQGITKRDLARYYAAVAARMLPHIANRPLMLVRCPQGEGHRCFHQKHPTRGVSADVHRVPLMENSGATTEHMMVCDERGLISLVQIGALETKAERKGKVLIDYLRNGRGATAARLRRFMDPQTEPQSNQEPPEIAPIVKRIGEGLKTLAQDEVELATTELFKEIKKPLASAGAIVLGGIIALVGVGLVCTTVVVALEPLIPPLWLRLAIMSVAYFAVGRVVMGIYMKRFELDATPERPREAQADVEAAESEITRG
jgi:hypothetical protein